MKNADLIKKYADLSGRADRRMEALHTELKAARKAKNDESSGFEELADYEDAKSEYLSEKRVAQIYGQVCSDLGDSPN